MGNYQQDLMDIMVKKVLSKHNVTPVSDLSEEDKEKVKKVVGEIQSEVESFLENQNKTLSEQDFQSKDQPKVEAQNTTNPVVHESLQKIIKSNNDLDKVKMFLNKLK
ncbi:hypothetical protein [Halalkalibacter alkalisediminis]|uniref:Uncharacterized protein n=1 Tax=Halalkalibacter alkalisediminis TaxID=935616 RepID=A0ABV6NBV6_9BACI|nr:hypothetical protein [Halalkalibacter alkalisediminis]